MTLTRASKCNVTTPQDRFFFFSVYTSTQTNGTGYGGWEGCGKFPGPSHSEDEGRRREVTHTRGQGSSAALWLCDYSPAVQAPTHRLSLRLAIGFCFHSLSGEDEPNNALL